MMPRMVKRMVVQWWQPATEGDGWERINWAWQELDALLTAAFNFRVTDDG
jgi:hypothetical protein